MILTKEQVSFTKELIAVQVEQTDQLKDVVRQVNWRLVCRWMQPGTDLEWIWKLHIDTDLDQPDADSFVDYKDLDAETIMSWLNLSQEQESGYEGKCLKQFSEHVTASLANKNQPIEEDHSNWENRRWI